MKSRRSILLLAVVLTANFSLPTLLPAQIVPHPAAIAPGAPPLPMMKPPVAVFRELLAMTTADRERNLAERPQPIRERILAKLSEYESMNPADREMRLRMTDLRWYLRSFIELPPESRTNQLAMVPEEDRKLVNDSLEKWDRLPSDQQKAILTYDKTMDEFVSQRVNSASLTNRATVSAPPPPLPPDPFKNATTFMKLAPEQRQRLYASFQHFFDLPEDERQKTLDMLPASQRLQMANALTLFARLPKADREQYLNSFDKLSSMSDAERQDFLQNAERWHTLPPTEKQAWRALINHVPPMPPLPAEALLPPPPFPHPTLQATAN